MVITMVQVLLGVLLIVAGLTGWMAPISHNFDVSFYWRAGAKGLMMLCGVVAILLGAFVLARVRPVGTSPK